MQTGYADGIIPAVSPLSDVQFSRFTETEVAKLLTRRAGVGRAERSIIVEPGMIVVTVT